MSIHHPEKDLDCTNSARGVWLVKVPKYMREKWTEAPSSSEVGRLKILRNPGKLPTITLTLSESLSKENRLPKEHKFIMHNVKDQTLGVFSQTSVNPDALEAEKVFMEGQVIQKFECQPIVDRNYLQLKRDNMKKHEAPERKAVTLVRPAPTYKPRASHKHMKDLEDKKKAEGKKARDDKEKVHDMLFAAFEKHQYYNIKDLQKITRQPITYLKEILKEVCDYNVKNPHKNMWELKPEYRHYKEDRKETKSESE